MPAPSYPISDYVLGFNQSKFIVARRMDGVPVLSIDLEVDAVTITGDNNVYTVEKVVQPVGPTTLDVQYTPGTTRLSLLFPLMDDVPTGAPSIFIGTDDPRDELGLGLYDHEVILQNKLATTVGIYSLSDGRRLRVFGNLFVSTKVEYSHLACLPA